MLNKIQTRWLQLEVDTLTQEIEGSLISPKKYQVLSRKLDDTWEALNTKTNNLFAKSQAENLKEQLRKLYGDLEEKLVNREVSQIKEESSSLRQGRLTRKAIKNLESHITTLEERHCPSIPNRRIIAEAKQALLEAKARLEKLPVQHHFAMLASQASFPQEMLVPGDVEDLFDIAKDMYNQDKKRAKSHFTALAEPYKRQVEAHLKYLGAQLFEDSTETIQALMATANDLVGNGQGYPTPNDIEQFFRDLKQLKTILFEISKPGDVILIKGSRSNKLWQILEN